MILHWRRSRRELVPLIWDNGGSEPPSPGSQMGWSGDSCSLGSEWIMQVICGLPSPRFPLPGKKCSLLQRFLMCFLPSFLAGLPGWEGPRVLWMLEVNGGGPFGMTLFWLIRRELTYFWELILLAKIYQLQDIILNIICTYINHSIVTSCVAGTIIIPIL